MKILYTLFGAISSVPDLMSIISYHSTSSISAKYKLDDLRMSEGDITIITSDPLFQSEKEAFESILKKAGLSFKWQILGDQKPLQTKGLFSEKHGDRIIPTTLDWPGLTLSELQECLADGMSLQGAIDELIEQTDQTLYNPPFEPFSINSDVLTSTTSLLQNSD